MPLKVPKSLTNSQPNSTVAYQRHFSRAPNHACRLQLEEVFSFNQRISCAPDHTFHNTEFIWRVSQVDLHGDRRGARRLLSTVTHRHPALNRAIHSMGGGGSLMHYPERRQVSKQPLTNKDAPTQSLPNMRLGCPAGSIEVSL